MQEVAGGAKVQARHDGHAARSPGFPGPGPRRTPTAVRRRRRHQQQRLQSRGERQQLGGRTLRAQQSVRERVPQTATLESGPGLFVTATPAAADDGPASPPRDQQLQDQQATSSASTPEIREDATHHRRLVTSRSPSSSSSDSLSVRFSRFRFLSHFYDL